ncbi:MAG: HD domain-containing protein [Agriterribacter sp.]
MNSVEKVEAYAREVHASQRRNFADEPYINHLVRVKQLCATVSNDPSILSAALLHDVLEDTDTPESAMLTFLQSIVGLEQAKSIVQLVRELTDVYTSKAYPQWNRRKRKRMEAQRLAAVSSDAQTIKYADIIDNSQDILTIDSRFAEKLLWEYQLLLKVMTKGNPGLRSLAVSNIYAAMSLINTRTRTKAPGG